MVSKQTMMERICRTGKELGYEVKDTAPVLSLIITGGSCYFKVGEARSKAGERVQCRIFLKICI